MAQRKGGVNRPSFNPISCIQILFGLPLRYLNFALPLEPPWFQSAVFVVLTSANETECQNLVFHTFVPVFCLSVKFVALEAYEVGLASGKGS